MAPAALTLFGLGLEQWQDHRRDDGFDRRNFGPWPSSFVRRPGLLVKRVTGTSRAEPWIDE